MKLISELYVYEAIIIESFGYDKYEKARALDNVQSIMIELNLKGNIVLKITVTKQDAIDEIANYLPICMDIE